jgi:hypothetical protein
LTDVADLKNLCEVSKILYDATLPFLYRSITLKPSDARDLEDIDIGPLLQARDKGLLRYARDMTMESRFGECRIRCMHENADYDWMGEDEDIASTWMSLLEGFLDGNLRSFT